MVAYDFGIKHNILRRLAAQGCRLTVVPADYPAEKVLEMNPDGIFLSNGPVRAPSCLAAGIYVWCSIVTEVGPDQRLTQSSALLP